MSTTHQSIILEAEIQEKHKAVVAKCKIEGKAKRAKPVEMTNEVVQMTDEMDVLPVSHHSSVAETFTA